MVYRNKDVTRAIKWGEKRRDRPLSAAVQESLEKRVFSCLRGCFRCPDNPKGKKRLKARDKKKKVTREKGVVSKWIRRFKQGTH